MSLNLQNFAPRSTSTGGAVPPHLTIGPGGYAAAAYQQEMLVREALAKAIEPQLRVRCFSLFFYFLFVKLVSTYGMALSYVMTCKKCRLTVVALFSTLMISFFSFSVVDDCKSTSGTGESGEISGLVCDFPSSMTTYVC